MNALSITGTYSGLLEGSLEVASVHIREDMPGMVKHLIPGDKPLLVLDQNDHPLPPWLWLMTFMSPKGVTHDDPDYFSELIVVWFSDKIAFDKSINTIIGTLIADLDWDRYARDYDIMNF